MDPDDPLRQDLRRLHRELQEAGPLDAETLELLHEVRGDVEQALARGEGAPRAEDPSLREQLERALHHFEATHPLLASALSRALDSLGRAGL